VSPETNPGLPSIPTPTWLAAETPPAQRRQGPRSKPALLLPHRDGLEWQPRLVSVHRHQRA
jgi:hypothetical protein